MQRNLKALAYLHLKTFTCLGLTQGIFNSKASAVKTPAGQKIHFVFYPKILNLYRIKKYLCDKIKNHIEKDYSNWVIIMLVHKD